MTLNLQGGRRCFEDECVVGIDFVERCTLGF